MGRIIGIALLLVLLVALLAPRRSKRAGAEQRARNALAMNELREMVLSRQALAGSPPNPGAVRGVVMDWNLGEGTATLVAIDDGTVSLYMAEGGGIIGAGTKPAVAAAARRLLAEGARVQGEFAPTTNYAFPAKDALRFYVLTDSATLAAPPISAETRAGASPLGSLNEAAQALIAAIRKAS